MDLTLLDPDSHWWGSVSGGSHPRGVSTPGPGYYHPGLWLGFPVTKALALGFKAMACLLTQIPLGSQFTQTVGNQYRARRGWTRWPSLKITEGLECCSGVLGPTFMHFPRRQHFSQQPKPSCALAGLQSHVVTEHWLIPAVCSAKNGPPGPVLLLLENHWQSQRAADTKDIQRHHPPALNICTPHLKGTVTKVAKDSHMHAGALH